MQFSPVLTVVVGLVRGRTQLSLTNCTTLLPHHIELTMTICKCPQATHMQSIKIDGRPLMQKLVIGLNSVMVLLIWILPFTFCSASVTGGLLGQKGGLGLSTMVSFLHSSSCKILIISLINSQKITFSCSEERENSKH